jgi:hypothetical protein
MFLWAVFLNEWPIYLKSCQNRILGVPWVHTVLLGTKIRYT